MSHRVEVEHITVEPGAPLRPRAAPARVFGTCVDGWPALTRWTDAALAEALGHAREVRVGERPSFGPVFDRGQPLAEVAGIAAISPPRIVDLPAAEFLAALDRDGPPFHYFRDDFVECAGELLEDIKPARQLLLDPARCLVTLWIGQRLVRTHAHYDSYENFHVQLRGHKRFVLAGPEHWRAFAPYPLLHPSRAQARHDRLASPEDCDFAHSVIDLAPGDVLYIPPYWWHHTLALSPSVGVNFWSFTDDNEQVDTFEQALENQVQHDPAGAFELIRELLATAGDPFALADDLITHRYAPLFEAGLLPTSCPAFEPAPAGAPAQLLAWLRSRAPAQRELLALDLAEVIALNAVGAPRTGAYLLNVRDLLER